MDIIGRDETFSEHGFQVSGVRCQASSRVFTLGRLVVAKRKSLRQGSCSIK